MANELENGNLSDRREQITVIKKIPKKPKKRKRVLCALCDRTTDSKTGLCIYHRSLDFKQQQAMVKLTHSAIRDAKHLHRDMSENLKQIVDTIVVLEDKLSDVTYSLMLMQREWKVLMKNSYHYHSLPLNLDCFELFSEIENADVSPIQHTIPLIDIPSQE